MASDNTFPAIVIVDQGWVYYSPKTEIVFGGAGQVDWVICHDAQVIERFGTTAGLAQLKNGPTPETRLHAKNTKRIPFGRVVAFEECKVWEE